MVIFIEARDWDFSISLGRVQGVHNSTHNIRVRKKGKGDVRKVKVNIAISSH